MGFLNLGTIDMWGWIILCWASQVVLVIKNLPASAGDLRDAGLIPGSGRSPGGGHGNLLQYSCQKILWTEEPGGLQSIAGWQTLALCATECFASSLVFAHLDASSTIPAGAHTHTHTHTHTSLELPNVPWGVKKSPLENHNFRKPKVFLEVLPHSVG